MVILILIQIGGLVVITIMSGIMLLLNKKMGVADRLLIQDAFTLNTMAGLAIFVKKVLFGTSLIEGVGALLYMIVFVPEFGARGMVFPENESGIPLAKNLLSLGFVDLISLSDEVSMVEIDIKDEWKGKNLIELNLRKKYGLNVVAMKKTEK